MKGLKKLALATAVAAAPFAHADLVAMDDSALGQMTGQAGITIDVDLQMSIDAIKYVDSDGNADGSGEQGAVTMKGIRMGSLDNTNNYAFDATDATARIRGITVDADGSDGLVIGLNEIGDTAGNGIDIAVDAVIIGTGAADLAKTEVNVAIASSTEVGNAATAAVSDGAFADATEYQTALQSGDQTAIGYLAAADANVASAVQTAQSGTAGNIGGIVIENFRNYIQDDLVNKYNGVFDMALQDSEGTVGGVTGPAGTTGRFVRGEIVVNGTGTYDAAGNGAASTGGLQISGKFGGAMDKAAWVDSGGGEFGIKDMGFFLGVDENSDGISDVIEGMHFSVNIDVVERASSVAGTNVADNSAIAAGDTVAQLQISDMQFEGTIMMGEIYVGNLDSTVQTSLGSVLVKDIDMTGTSVYVYGH